MANNTIKARAKAPVAAAVVVRAAAAGSGAPGAARAAVAGLVGGGAGRGPAPGRCGRARPPAAAARPPASHSSAAMTSARGTVTSVPRSPCQPMTAAINSGLRAAPRLPPTEKIDMEAPRRRRWAAAATTAPAGWNSADPSPPRATHTSSHPNCGASPTAP